MTKTIVNDSTIHLHLFVCADSNNNINRNTNIWWIDRLLMDNSHDGALCFFCGISCCILCSDFKFSFVNFGVMYKLEVYIIIAFYLYTLSHLRQIYPYIHRDHHKADTNQYIAFHRSIFFFLSRTQNLKKRIFINSSRWYTSFINLGKEITWTIICFFGVLYNLDGQKKHKRFFVIALATYYKVMVSFYEMTVTICHTKAPHWYYI